MANKLLRHRWQVTNTITGEKCFYTNSRLVDSQHVVNSPSVKRWAAGAMICVGVPTDIGLLESRCEHAWNTAYPDRAKWCDIGKAAQDEWVRVFGIFDNIDIPTILALSKVEETLEAKNSEV